LEDAMLALVPWVVFLHVLTAFTFFLAHGTSVAMAFKIRSETKFERIRAMLDLSGSTIGVMFISFLAMGLTGLILPFMLKIWNTGWVWTSIILMVLVVVQMGFISERRYKPLRRLVGMPYMVGNKEFPAEEPASAEEVQAHLKKLKIGELVGVGYVIPMIVLWLMVFKPF
jgi:small-conductance mechanosensitive channel